MGYKNLNYIIEIAQQRNMSRAAEKLFISQSALSIYLKKLEAELGVNLFVRTNTTLIPTPEGELFIETAKEILRLEQEFYKKIAHASHQLTSFGVASELAMQIFLHAFSHFKESHPGFRTSVVDGRTEALLSRLRKGDLDFIIVPDFAVHSDPWLECKLLKKEDIVFALPPHHPLAHLASGNYENPPAVNIDVFRRDSYIIGAPDTVEYAIIQKLFEEYRIKPNILCEINLTRQACQMAIDNCAITLQPAFCVPRDMGLLVCKPDRPYCRYLLLLYQKNRLLTKEEGLFIKSIQYFYDHWYTKAAAMPS